jgi:type I restriction enzyme S subunit
MTRPRDVEADLKSHPAYKDSGVPWLGKVPEHWELLRLGGLLRERGETNDDGRITEVLSLVAGRGVIPYAEKGNIGNKKSEDITRYKIVRPDDIVVNCMNVIIGSVGLSKYTGCLSPVYYVLVRRSQEDDPGYLNSCFQVVPFQKGLIRIGNGILAHRMRIPMELLKCELFPHPPLPEQAAIVRYLTHMDQQVRQYIRAKQKLIKLLEEQKQAIIQQAVTRGLDPNVRLKPSGVKWLGDIPEHWQAKKLKHHLRRPLAYGVLKPDKFEGDNGIPIIRILDVSGGEICREHLDRISPLQDSEFARTRVMPGDVILSVVGTIGRSAVIPDDIGQANISRALCRIQLTQSLLATFLDYFCYSRAFLDQADSIPAGTAQRVLNLSDLRQFDICLPPLDEQSKIVDRLDTQARGLDDLISQVYRQIYYLREYQTRLILDAVTGKLDVRDIAAGLPEMPEVQEQPFEEESSCQTEEDCEAGDLDAQAEEADE